MDTSTICSRIETTEKALLWIDNVPASEQLSFHERIVNFRREYKKIKFAAEERPSVAAFGESQMGKSYLVSAMLSSPNSQFTVTDGEKIYNFIDDINPSAPNSSIEATGVITRFTTQEINLPSSRLQAQLLSVADIILVLCEAYYNQVDYTYESIMSTEEINDMLKNISINKNRKEIDFLGEDDVMDIREYLQTTSIQKKCHTQLSSDLFDFLLQNLYQLTHDQLIRLVKLIWNNNTDINRLFDDLVNNYSKLHYKSTVYVEFKSVLKKHGTLLDVARLDEMYGEPEVRGSEYISDVNVLIDESTKIDLPKSFFSALIAELTFSLPNSTTKEREFLKDLDILDFPGWRRPEQFKEDKLTESKNLSTALRRGKVTYLFNKYSKAKRITALLFCHNNNQSAESVMGEVLSEWINTNIGDTATKRDVFIDSSTVSPLFVVGTWFNKDLEYSHENKGDFDRLNERWQRRFNVILEKEVLKSINVASHWFNEWTTHQHPFSNIFMLRDFRYSTVIFEGFSQKEKRAECGVITHEEYPDFLDDLRKSFIANPFVKTHFQDPVQSWDSAATIGNDGTKPIIQKLCELSPHSSDARAKKLTADMKQLDDRLVRFLEQYYHPDDDESQLKQAKKQAGEACLLIDKILGKDSYFFGRLMGRLMISETEMYELVHKQILGANLPPAMNTEESSIFMGAGLSASVSREDNIIRLCDYLGAEDEEECRERLMSEGINLDRLLEQIRMVTSEEDHLVSIAELQWHDDFLMKRTVGQIKDVYAPIDVVVSKLWMLYGLLNVHENLVQQVRVYMRNLDKKDSVSIIADYLAMQFNAFVNSFGYDFLPAEERLRISKQNEKLHLGINEKILSMTNKNEGLALLADLDKKNDILSEDGFSSDKREFLLRFPQYKSIWQWQQKLRFGYAYACKLPSHDPVANAAMKKIISQIN